MLKNFYQRLFNPETFYVQDNIEEQINIEKQAMLENMQSIPLFSDFLQKTIFK